MSETAQWTDEEVLAEAKKYAIKVKGCKSLMVDVDFVYAQLIGMRDSLKEAATQQPQDGQEFLDSIARVKEVSLAEFVRWLRAMANVLEKQHQLHPSDWAGTQTIAEWIAEAETW